MILALIALLPVSGLLLALAVPVQPAPTGSPGPVRRAVLFPPVLWSYLTLDQGAANIVATASYQRDAAADGLLGKIYPGAKVIETAATLGADTAIPGDPEQILRLRPDAVFTWAWFSNGLENLGLPIVRMTFDSSKGSESTIAEWRTIAAAAGQQVRFDHILDGYNARMRAVQTELQGIAIADKPSAIFLFVYAADTMYVATGKSRPAQFLAQAGARNVAANLPGGRVDREELLRLDPDVIILSCCFRRDITPEFFYDSPELQNLKAVRNRRIYKQPIGGSRMEGLVEEPLLLRWLAELFHPDQMRHSFRAAFVDAYRDIYGSVLSSQDVDEAIFVRANAQSTGYERFRENGSPR